MAILIKKTSENGLPLSNKRKGARFGAFGVFLFLEDVKVDADPHEYGGEKDDEVPDEMGHRLFPQGGEGNHAKRIGDPASDDPKE